MQREGGRGGREREREMHNGLVKMDHASSFNMIDYTYGFEIVDTIVLECNGLLSKGHKFEEWEKD